MNEDFAEAAEPREPVSGVTEPASEPSGEPVPDEPVTGSGPDGAPPKPPYKKLPDLKGVMMRTGPFLNAAGKGLRAAVRVTAAVLRVIWRILCAIGRFLHRVFRKDSIPNLILVLALLTAVTAAGLGVIYTVTGPQIEAARAEAFDAAMGEVFPGLELAFVKSSFGENVYEGRDADGNLAGFSILVSPDGYSGPIGMIVGVDLRREVTGVTVVSQRETRGFDAKGTMQNGFLEQFAGKNGPFALGNGIDAISGATISSEAVTQGVNDALALLDREIQP